MKKYMFLLAVMMLGFTAMADVKPESTDVQTQQSQLLIPVYAEIASYLYPSGPPGELWVKTSAKVHSAVTYTIRFRGHPSGIFEFVVRSYNDSSERYYFPEVIAGRGEIIAVSPESDDTYDYTAAIGTEIEW